MARTLADRRREEEAYGSSVSQQPPFAQQNGGNATRGRGRPPKTPKVSTPSTFSTATSPNPRSVGSSTSQPDTMDEDDFDIDDVIRRLAHNNPSVAEAAFKEATTHRHGIINKPDENTSLRFWFMYLFLDLHIYGLSLENCLQRFSLPSLEYRGRDTLTDRKLTCIKKIRKVWPSNFRTQLVAKGVRLPLEPYDGIFSKLVMIAIRENLTIDDFANEFLEWLPKDLLTRNEGKGSMQALASWNSGERHITNIDLENYLLFRGEKARKERVEGLNAQGSPRGRGESAAQAQVSSRKRGASSPLSRPSRRPRLSSTPVVEELSPRIAEEMDREIDDMVSDSEITFVSPRALMQHSATPHSPVQPTLELQIQPHHQSASLPRQQADFTPSSPIPEKARNPSPQVIIPSRAAVARGAGSIECPSIPVTQTSDGVSSNATASSASSSEIQAVLNERFRAAPTAALVAPRSNSSSPSPSSSINGPPVPSNMASLYESYLSTLEIEGYPCFQCRRRYGSAHSLYNHNQAPCTITPGMPVLRVSYKATKGCGMLVTSSTAHKHISPYQPVKQVSIQPPTLNIQAPLPPPLFRTQSSAPVPGQTQAASRPAQTSISARLAARIHTAPPAVTAAPVNIPPPPSGSLGSTLILVQNHVTPCPPQNILSAPSVGTSPHTVSSSSVNIEQSPPSSTQSSTSSLVQTRGRRRSPRVSTPRLLIVRDTTATSAGNRSSVLRQSTPATTISTSTPRAHQVLLTVTPAPVENQLAQIPPSNAGDRHSLLVAIKGDDEINVAALPIARVSNATPAINPGMTDSAATAPPSRIFRAHSTLDLVCLSSPSRSSTLSSQQYEPFDPSEIQTYLDGLPALEERKQALRDARTHLLIANEKVANSRTSVFTDIDPITANLAKAVRARSRYKNYLAECDAEDDAAGAQANRDLIIAHTHKIAALEEEKAKAEKALQDALKAQQEVEVAKQSLEHAIKEEKKAFDTLAAAAAEVRKLQDAAQKEKERLMGIIEVIDRQAAEVQVFLTKWCNMQKDESS
jgi:predicted  nucleic acid-binding Zn-ribbon protein